MAPSTRTRRAVTVTVAALTGALLTWLVLPYGEGALGSVPTGAGPDQPTVAAPVAPPGGAAERDGRTPQVATRPATLRPAAGSPVPTRLQIPRLRLTLPVRPGGVDEAGAMALPETAYAVSWYRFGPGPLDRAGATVLAGHVDTEREGTGPLAGLGALRAGDTVLVRAGARDVRYVVTAVTRVAKSVVDLPAIFSRVGPARLHLVTCGGAYLPDAGGYQDNVVVSARRTG